MGITPKIYPSCTNIFSVGRSLDYVLRFASHFTRDDMKLKLRQLKK